ncbi:MAG: hypothetical protein GQ570_03985 [Helicobacteraceae bacterium]|nr:hypothetical protein [Helicobacteraceae bacterium]
MAVEVELPAIHQNDYRNHKVTVSGTNNSIIDVTGDKFWLTIKEDPEAEDDASAAYQVSVVAPADANSQAGEAYLPITLVDVNIPAGTYFYDIQWQRLASGGGVKDLNTVIYGKINILSQVTRDTA